jgi:hypothetical protein
MAVALGKNFRRLLAQALSIDEGEKRALIERLLPRGEGGKRVLRLESDADRQSAPLAIAAALSDDAITGEEAEELKRQAENAGKPAETGRPWWEDPPPGIELLSTEECRRLGYVWPLEQDPLRESILAWRESARRWAPAVPSDKAEVDPPRCSAADEHTGLENINENTSADPRRGAEKPDR